MDDLSLIACSLIFRRDRNQKAAAGAQKAFEAGEQCKSLRFRHRLRGAAKKDPIEGATKERATCIFRPGRWHFRKHLPEPSETGTGSINKMEAQPGFMRSGNSACERILCNLGLDVLPSGLDRHGYGYVCAVKHVLAGVPLIDAAEVEKAQPTQWYSHLSARSSMSA